MHTTCKPGAAAGVALVCALAGVALFYAASEPDTYRAEAWDGSTVARGMTMPQCLENYFNRPAVAGCIRE